MSELSLSAHVSLYSPGRTVRVRPGQDEIAEKCESKKASDESHRGCRVQSGNLTASH